MMYHFNGNSFLFFSIHFEINVNDNNKQLNGLMVDKFRFLKKYVLVNGVQENLNLLTMNSLDKEKPI